MEVSSRVGKFSIHNSRGDTIHYPYISSLFYLQRGRWSLGRKIVPPSGLWSISCSGPLFRLTVIQSWSFLSPSIRVSSETTLPSSIGSSLLHPIPHILVKPVSLTVLALPSTLWSPPLSSDLSTPSFSHRPPRRLSVRPGPVSSGLTELRSFVVLQWIQRYNGNLLDVVIPPRTHRRSNLLQFRLTVDMQVSYPNRFIKLWNE